MKSVSFNTNDGKKIMKILRKSMRRDMVICVNMLKSQHDLCLIVPTDEIKKDLSAEFDLNGEQLNRVFTFFDLVSAEERFSIFKKCIVMDMDKLLQTIVGNIQIVSVIF